MSNNRFFLYQYAIVLYDAREYNKALKAIIAYENICTGYNSSLLKGDIYKELHTYKLAEKSYVRAKNMCPSRFLPLFKLFLLYQQSGQFSNASKIANMIVSKQIKVKSKFVKDIIYIVSQIELNKRF